MKHEARGKSDAAAALLGLLLPAEATVITALAGRGAADDLRRADAVILLDPPGGPGALSAAGFPYHRRFGVLPDADRPRWLIPLDSGRIAASALALVAPYRRVARAKHLAARAAASIGAPRWYRHVLSFHARATPPLESWIAAAMGVPVRIGVARGAPGARPKPALIVLDARGRAIAFAKLGRDARRRATLRREASALSTLAAHLQTAGLGPRLLADAEVEDTYVTLQEPLAGRPGPTSLRTAHDVFLGALSAGGDRRPVGSSAFVRSVAERATGTDARLLSRLAMVLDGVRLQRTIVHGDFAPWNIRMEPSRLRAFDWEWWCPDGLPLVDGLHHLLQVGFLLERWTVERAAARLQAHAGARPLGLTTPQVHALQGIAILDYVLHIVEDGYSEGPLGSRYRALLDRVAALADA